MSESFAGYFRDYALAFDAFDPERIACFFHLPCLMVDRGGAAVLTTRDQLLENMRAVLEHHRQQGYARAAVCEIEAHRQAASLATAQLRWRILREDDSPLWDWRNSYQLVDYGEGWKIAVSTTHAE